MKKIIALFLLSMFAMQVPGVIYAMDGGGCCPGCGMNSKGGQSMEKMHEKHVNKMTKDLNLTPEQREKVLAIMEGTGEKRKAEMDKMRESAKADMEATDAQIKGVLTPEQAVQYDKQKAERKDKMEKKMKKKMKKGHKQHKNMEE